MPRFWPKPASKLSLTEVPMSFVALARLQRARLVCALVLMALGGCPDPRTEPHEDGGVDEPDAAVDGGDDTCKVRGQLSALSVVDRSILGSPADYAADLTLRAREDELESSML